MTHPTLIAGAARLGIDLSDLQAQQLIQLLDELDDWNTRVNLTAIRERDAQITKHLLDSLSVRPWMVGNHFIDVGTGAGFPGLPLAIVMPQAQFVLLDSTLKKLRFIDHVVALLGLTNVQTVHSRAEAYKPADRFDGVLARAVGPVPRLMQFSSHLCAGHGRILAMKGREPMEEIEKLPSGWKLAAVHVLQVPELDEQRHLVEICRSHERLVPRAAAASTAGDPSQ